MKKIRKTCFALTKILLPEKLCCFPLTYYHRRIIVFQRFSYETIICGGGLFYSCLTHGAGNVFPVCDYCRLRAECIGHYEAPVFSNQLFVVFSASVYLKSPVYLLAEHYPRKLVRKGHSRHRHPYFRCILYLV